jgi:hypothetical protein
MIFGKFIFIQFNKRMEKILNNKWWMLFIFTIALAVTILSIYVFLAGGNFIAILETLY